MPTTATTKEIKKAFRKLALEHHPDRGGDKQKFQAVNTAHETLSDENKRRIYDEHGEEGVVGQTENTRPRKRYGNLRYDLSVTLADIYNGSKKEIKFCRERVCLACAGVGGKPGSAVKCTGCGGIGITVTTQILGPGMMSQQTRTCATCEGSGEIIDQRLKCKTCIGKKTVTQEKVIEVQIDKGAPDGQEYVFHGEGSEVPGFEPGDLVVVLSETVSDSDIFKRSGADLVIEKKIMLLEALIGADFLVDHLNGSQIRIQTDNKNTIKPDETRTVEGLGMPIHEKPYVFGNMFIVFKVEFPQSIPI